MQAREAKAIWVGNYEEELAKSQQKRVRRERRSLGLEARRHINRLTSATDSDDSALVPQSEAQAPLWTAQKSDEGKGAWCRRRCGR